MFDISTRISRVSLVLLAPCLLAQFSAAGSLYHYNVALDPPEKPTLQLTNDSKQPIFAFVMVEFPSLGMEGRTYYDFYVNHRELPIAPGSSTIRGLSSFRGAEAKVRAEVRAVIFQDGTADGDPVWVNAILAQRLRLYDRLLSVHELLEKQVGTEISREGILQMLQAAQTDAEKQSAHDDDLRPVDSTVFHGAISTFENNRQAPVTVVLERYIAYLRLRIAQLQRSRPAMETIRTLPITTPKPLSESDLPADLRSSAFAHKDAAPSGTLSYCTNGVFATSDTPLSECRDSENTGNLGYTNTQYNSFSTIFTQYTASTGKTTDAPWSWSPGPNDLKTAYGLCVSFTDCDQANDVFFKTGTATGQGAATNGALPKTVYQGQNSVSFWWLYDYYPPPSFSACDDCDIYPEGEYNPTSADTPEQGIVFFFGYSCTVTP